MGRGLFDGYVNTIAAYNKKKPFHPKAMKWLGYIITIDDTQIYISGDTDITPESQNVSCDIALVPVGGFFTIDPQQAAALINEIAPHTSIPIHYGKLLGGTDAPDQFRSTLNNNINADIRPSVYSSVLVSMYAKTFGLFVVMLILGYLAGRYF